MMKKGTRKRIGLCVSVALVLGFAIGGVGQNHAPAVAAPQYSRFDVNLDGIVNGLDLAFLMEYYSMTNAHPGWDDIAERCDFNEDGRIDVIDLVLLYSNFTPGLNADYLLDLGQVEQGNEYVVALRATDIDSFASMTATISYDPAKLQLMDVAAQANSAYTTAGAIPGTGITVTSASPGEAELEFDMSIPQGKAWSGVLTVLKFKALASGDATITATYNGK